MKPLAIIFDFDGVLVESEHAESLHTAGTLTGLGHPTTVQDAISRFTGLAGQAFDDAVGAHIGGPVPEAFRRARQVEQARLMEGGLPAVAGAVDFVRRLPAGLPRAIASSSSTTWIERHLRHLGLSADFGDRLFSGREHVARGKPAPDLYLFAAQRMNVPIGRTLIIEDSVVGAKGAVASGAFVVGLCAASHCLDGHARRLLAQGVHRVVTRFDEIDPLLDTA